MKNEMLKSTLFLQADILMLDWCIGSATQKEVGRLFGTMHCYGLTHVQTLK